MTIDEAINHILTTERSRYDGQQPRADELVAQELDRLRSRVLSFINSGRPAYPSELRKMLEGGEK